MTNAPKYITNISNVSVKYIICKDRVFEQILMVYQCEAIYRVIFFSNQKCNNLMLANIFQII